MNTLAFAIIGHLIGDYLLQNDWMAGNKKGTLFPPKQVSLAVVDEAQRKWRTGTIACFVHVALYTLAIGLLTFWPWWALLIVAVTHFIQDRTQIIGWWMRFNRQEQFMKPPLAPWSIIVVDNVWHLVVLAAIARFLV